MPIYIGYARLEDFIKNVTEWPGYDVFATQFVEPGKASDSGWARVDFAGVQAAFVTGDTVHYWRKVFAKFNVVGGNNADLNKDERALAVESAWNAIQQVFESREVDWVHALVSLPEKVFGGETDLLQFEPSTSTYELAK